MESSAGTSNANCCYWVEYDLEYHYKSLKDLTDTLDKMIGLPVQTILNNGKRTFGRMYFTSSVEKCLTLIKPTPFHRVSSQSKIFDEEDIECYPIVIYKFESSDSKSPCIISAEVKWIGSGSILWDTPISPLNDVLNITENCNSVTFVSCKDRIHPWLTPNRGNILHSCFCGNYFWEKYKEVFPLEDPYTPTLGESFEKLYQYLSFSNQSNQTQEFSI